MDDDFVSLMLNLTTYIQNVRTASYNEGVDATKDKKRFLFPASCENCGHSIKSQIIED